MSIQRTLLERIRRPGPAGQRQLHVSTSDLFDSILTNLQNVLNTCQGNVKTDARYGLPHMSEIRSAIPLTLAGYMSAIRTTIERHEPRLSNVRVRHAPSANHPMELRFEVSGVVEDEEERRSVRFETFADDAGRLKIR